MKSLLTVGLAVMFSAAVLAQPRGNHAPPLVGKSFPAVGGALPLVGPGYPAIGGALPIVNPFSGSVPFAQRLGATIGGFPQFRGTPAFGRHGGSHRGGNRGYIGYGGYPLLYPTFGPLAEQYDQSADYGAPVPPPQQQQIYPQNDQNYLQEPQAEPQEERPRIQTYTAPSAPRPEPSEEQPLFFIALRDSSVYTAVAYWVENGTLNYVTPQGRHNQVSLALIDRDTTSRLNQGSKFQLHLPGA